MPVVKIFYKLYESRNKMIRKAVPQDIESVENIYNELLKYEQENGAFTAWQAGIYPTRQTAEKALLSKSLYVLEQEGKICASLILNQIQPEEYSRIKWKYDVNPREILIIHLLCVDPSKSRCGLGTKMIKFAVKNGKQMNCRVIRLDTGLQNKPAIALYKKFGFEIAERSDMSIGGVIEHRNHLFMEMEI